MSQLSTSLDISIPMQYLSRSGIVARFLSVIVTGGRNQAERAVQWPLQESRHSLERRHWSAGIGAPASAFTSVRGQEEPLFLLEAQLAGDDGSSIVDQLLARGQDAPQPRRLIP